MPNASETSTQSADKDAGKDINPTRRLLDIVATLRNPDGGCPWDAEQTFETIAPHTIEEAYEVADAIARRDMESLKDELGDLMFQVVFHSQMASEAGQFTYADVINGVSDKMIRRHPHVFGDQSIETAEAQTRNWEDIKAAERAAKRARSNEPKDNSALTGVPVALPSLTRAEKLQKRAARVGFDWPETAPVIGKVREELAEVEAELGPAPDQIRVEEELGDLLFAVVNLARRLKVDPETALRKCNRKFGKRFRAMEADLAARSTPIDAPDTDLTAMEAAWRRAKASEIK